MDGKVINDFFGFNTPAAVFTHLVCFHTLQISFICCYARRECN